MSDAGHRRVDQAQGGPPLPARQGRYTDDITLPGQLRRVRALAVRAREHPAIDAAARAQAPGVLAVLHRRRRRRRRLGGIPCGWLVKTKDGSNMVEPPHPALAQGKRRATSAIRSRW